MTASVPSSADELLDVVEDVVERSSRNNVVKYRETKARQDRLLELVANGTSIQDALLDPGVGVSYSAYRKWRERHKGFRQRVDVLRAEVESETAGADLMGLSSAAFALRYFKRRRAPFQQLWIDTKNEMQPGDILMALWPPEHGKTTTFEDDATETIARDPTIRYVVGAEGKDLSKRIIGRVRKRLEIAGPYPELVRDFGPFRPDIGAGKDSMFHQPWNDEAFAVFKNRLSDDREPNMLALGGQSSVIGTRTDRLHIDDAQSLKTLGQTETILNRMRQDWFSRPGEHGTTTINGSRVGDDDIYEHLENDEDLEGILHVIKLKALTFDLVTQTWKPLWPEYYSYEKLMRMKRKVGAQAFDRSYMQDPGASSVKHRTFSDDGIARCLNDTRRLNDREYRSDARTVYLSLDPALGNGLNCIMAFAVSREKMTLVYLKESQHLERNEDIIRELASALAFLSPHYRVSDLIIESMNFQRGLARDQRLIELRDQWGFALREHLTGLNKYDESIGVASMAGAVEAGQFDLPYLGSDPLTKYEVDQIISQMKKWKPNMRGNKLRQDRIMAMWFAWILWSQRRRHLEANKTGGWKMNALPYGKTNSGLILPPGMRF